MEEKTPRFDLPIIREGTANPYVVFREWTDKVDALLSPVLESRTTLSPPTNPVSGKSYLVPEGATGEWADHIGKLASWNGVGYVYSPVPNGFKAEVVDEGNKEVASHNGSVEDLRALPEYDTFSFDTDHFKPTVTDGATVGVTNLKGTKVNLSYYRFPESTDKYIYTQFDWPKQADLNDIKVALSLTSDRSDTGRLKWEFLFFWWDHAEQKLKSQGGNIAIDFITADQRIRNDRLYSLISDKFSIPQDLSIINALSGMQIGRIGTHVDDDFDQEIRFNSATIQYKVLPTPRASW